MYHDPERNMLVMEDSWGRYLYDLERHVYEEDVYEEKVSDPEPYPNKVWVGRINGQAHPLKFETGNQSSPRD